MNSVFSGVEDNSVEMQRTNFHVSLFAKTLKAVIQADLLVLLSNMKCFPTFWECKELKFNFLKGAPVLMLYKNLQGKRKLS